MRYYITTTLPYVNADPHIGFAMEIVEADCLARFHRSLGYRVIFNFGTDEHGQKIYQKALEKNQNPKAYVDEYAKKFNNLKKALNLSYDKFIRTTDQNHIKAAQKFWELCDQKGLIDKKTYETKYCVGCEMEITDSELVNGRCPLHPDKKIELRQEENYFFKFSKFQKPLLEFYKKNPDFVLPKEKYNEVIKFVESGIKDFSISRLKSKMPWGIEVPNDPDHVMYVWFDALINYISTLGWPDKKISDWWPGIQIAGKDNLRQQSAIWQAMLMAADIPNTKQIFIHSFVTQNGQKISKSQGIFVNPYDLIKKYGTDALRYYLLAKLNPYLDSDFTVKKFENTYQADLANGLGNLVSRVFKLADQNKIKFKKNKTKNPIIDELKNHLEIYRFDLATKSIWALIKKTDKYLNENKPWEKKSKNKKFVISNSLTNIYFISEALSAFLPETSEKIISRLISEEKLSGMVLFPRLK